MVSYVLIDLCFPGALADAQRLAQRAAEVGLQSVVYVCDGVGALPDQATIDAIAADSTLATLHPAVMVRGAGYAYVILVEDWTNSPLLAALPSIEDPRAIEQATLEAGGCALPVSPRQGPDGEVYRVVTLPSEGVSVGTVAQVAGGTILARDLDVEDAAMARRRILAGTGPYGSFEDLGRFATLFQIPPRDIKALIGALNGGLGLALETLGEGGPAPKKKRRRRNRRPRRRKGAEETPTESASTENEA